MRAPQDFPRRSRCAKRMFHSSPIVSNATNSAYVRRRNAGCSWRGRLPIPLRVSRCGVRPARLFSHRSRKRGPDSRLRGLVLKAVQKLLGHESIQTTGDIYTDWDIEQLAKTLLEAVDE